MNKLTTREVKHQLMLDNGFKLYDNSVYVKEINGRITAINSQEFERNYIHQLQELIKQRIYMCMDAQSTDTIT